MPASFTTIDFGGIVEQFPGRGVVLGGDYWDESGAISLTHRGETEGVIRLTPSSDLIHVRIPELTGQAPLRSWERNGEPTVTIPIFLADPEAHEWFTPTGVGSAGSSRPEPVLYRTLAIIPEDVLWDEATRSYSTLTFDGVEWTINATPPTERQQSLLDQTLWLWKIFPERAPVSFGVADEGRQLQEVTIHVSYDQTKPERNRLYSFGRHLVAAGINLEGAGS